MWPIGEFGTGSLEEVEIPQNTGDVAGAGGKMVAD